LKFSQAKGGGGMNQITNSSHEVKYFGNDGGNTPGFTLGEILCYLFLIFSKAEEIGIIADTPKTKHRPFRSLPQPYPSFLPYPGMPSLHAYYF